MGIRMTNITTPMPQPRAKFTNKLGLPLSGGRVYTYEPGTNIPKKTWKDIDKSVENTNPIQLDAAGEADIYGVGFYRVVVKDFFGLTIYDVEKTGIAAELDASFVVDASGKNQQELNSQYKTPVQFDIDTTGASDVTTKITNLLNPAGKGIIQLTPGKYWIDGLTIPKNVIVYANGAEFIRRRWTNEPLILMEEGSVLVNAKVNGNKEVLGNPLATANRSNRGVIMRKNSYALLCESYGHSSHGFYLVAPDVMDFENPSENQKVFFCKSHDNGFNPGPSGSGDGFCATNTSNSLYFGCEAWGNARTGFVATTYDAITLGENAAYSQNPKAQHCKAWDNGYSDFNFECVSQPEISNIVGRDISFSKSPNAQIHNIAKIGAIYASGADYANVSGIKIENDTRSASLLYIYGKSPQVHNVNIVVGDSATMTGITAEVVDPVSFEGSISNISINKASTGILAGVANASNLSVTTASTQKYRIRRAAGLTSVPDFKLLTNGKIDCYAAAQPAAGVWNKGDMVLNSTLTTNVLGWICVVSGDYGATPPAWKIIALNELQLTGSKTYDPPSLAALGAAGDSVTTTVTIVGVALGDTVNTAFSQYNAAIEISPQVSAANTVTVKFKNTSAAAVDLPSGTLTVKKI